MQWLDVYRFNLQKYQHFTSFENGNVSELVMGKLLAFCPPGILHVKNDGMMSFTPEDVIPIFKNYNVTLVIRLCDTDYESSRFKRYGFKFLDFPISESHSPTEVQF